MKFPKKIHVTIESPGNEEPYLVALADGVESLEQEQSVAVYQLVEVRRLEITKTLK